MAHSQKPDFVFRRNGRVHLNRRGRQTSDYWQPRCKHQLLLLVVMLDTPCSEVVWRVLTTHSIRQFPLHFPSMRHRMPSHFNWILQIYWRFGWNCCLQFQDRSRSRSLGNVSRLLPDSQLHTPRSRYSNGRLMCSCSYRLLAWVMDLILRNHKECIWETCFRPPLRSMDPDNIWSFWPLM